MLEIKKVNEDERGSIYSITGDEIKPHHELVLLCTKKGYARGGCIHYKNAEYIVIIEGKVDYHIRRAEIWMKKGDTEYIPATAPHYLVSKTDSIVMEWGPEPNEKDTKDSVMREYVNKINRKAKEAEHV